MDKEQLVGCIIMALCCFGCAATFQGIGIHAARSDEPVSFWSGGPKVEAKHVNDIYGYNQACSSMWKLYAIPYWVAGIVACLGFLGDGYLLASAIIMTVACFPGLFFLIWRYKHIEKTYIQR